MPLDTTTPTSIGSVYITETALVGGTVCYVDVDPRFLALVGRPRIVAVGAALDNRQRVDAVARRLRGRFAWTVRHCPPALAAALTALVGAGLQTASVRHPSVGASPLALRVEVLGLDLTDSQDVATDPVDDLVIDLLSHGAP